MAIYNGDDGNNTLIGGAASDELNGFGGNDFLQGGDGVDTVLGGSGNDTMGGNSGNDWLQGGAGNDSIGGGGGQDRFAFADFGAGNADVLTDFAGGWDNIQLDLSGFSGLSSTGRFVSGDARFFAGAAAHDADDRVIYNQATGQLWYDADGNGAGAAQLIATLSNRSAMSATDIFVFQSSATPPPTQGQTITGGWGPDSLVGTEGDDTMDGVDGMDTLVGLGGNDLLSDSGIDFTNDARDSLLGGAGNDTLRGNVGNDTLNGGEGNDLLEGGEHFDSYVFDIAPGSANADTIVGFEAARDTLVLDAAVMGALGTSGTFATNDPRFHAAAGANAGHDADDRVVYNTSTGQLWYDADGNGAGGAQLIATLSGAPALSTSNISVANGTSSGQSLNGTAGNDSIMGTEGADTINGFGGNDTLGGSAGDDRIDGGAGDDSVTGGEGADSMIGGDGNDTLDGDASRFGDWEVSVDTMNGGLGDDYYVVDNPNDVLIDSGGVDTVRAVNMSYTLAAGFENLIINNDESESTETGIGNELNNVIGRAGGSGWHVRLFGMGGNDTIYGSPQDDSLLSGGDGDDYIDGNWDYDVLDGGAGNDTLFGGIDDHDDTLTGGAGADTFAFGAQFGVAFDRVTDFASGTDSLQFDGRDFPELGASGRFAAGDARFYAAAGATSGHDADDRLIYDTTGHDLYFDPDGSGSAAAMRVASVGNVAATDIVVINGSGTPPPSGTISGTSGNDSLVGTAGSDTIDGGAGADTMSGGAGDDLYFVDNAGDRVVEAQNGGEDEVRTGLAAYTLSAWVNNLTMQAGAVSGTGNDITNVIVGNDAANQIRGGAANDTLTGGAGADSFIFNELGTANADHITDFVSGTDEVRLDGSVMTAIGPSGDFAAGDARFWTGTAAHDADDRVIFNSANGQLLYDADGNGSGAAQLIATVSGTVAATDIAVDNGSATPPPPPPSGTNGTEGNDTMFGTAGNDTLNGLGGNDAIQGQAGADRITGGAGNDTLGGNEGNDTLEGGFGNDALSGGGGQDFFVFREAGAANADSVSGFGSGWDALQLDDAGMADLGSAGRLASGDGRFWAAAGATSGHDGDDRVVYNTTTGQLYYDADGNGAGAAAPIATLTGAPTLAASDITVI